MIAYLLKGSRAPSDRRYGEDGQSHDLDRQHDRDPRTFNLQRRRDSKRNEKEAIEQLSLSFGLLLRHLVFFQMTVSTAQLKEREKGKKEK